MFTGQINVTGAIARLTPQATHWLKNKWGFGVIGHGDCVYNGPVVYVVSAVEQTGGHNTGRFPLDVQSAGILDKAICKLFLVTGGRSFCQALNKI